VAAVALVAVDAARFNTCELFEVGDDGTERVAVIGIAVQGLGMQYELPAFGRGGRRGNRDFAAKFVRCPGLAFADALHLGGVQRVDLGTALTLLLMANPVCEIEQRTKASSSAGSPSILRLMSRMMRPSRVSRNLSSRRARLN
jgi:hypothetical protein